MFEVILSPEARDFYAHADAIVARKLARCFQQLERSPRQHPQIKRLTGEFAGLLRFRVGDWRVVYRVEGSRVLVLLIAHRREVYD